MSTKSHTFTILALLSPLVFGFAIGQDIFVPEVPQIMGIFNTSQFMVQLTLSLFMLAVGGGQLVLGPLADQYGRKNIVLWSIALYVMGSIIAAAANSIIVLIMARIVEGIGACGMMVCAFAIVRDLYSGNESARVYSFLNGAVAVSPLLAPLLGGYLDVWFGWRAPFIALAVIGAVIFVLSLIYLQETHAKDRRIKFDFTIFKRYGQISCNKTFLVYTLTAASALACFFTFFSVSSYILIKKLGVAETHFGYYFALAGIIFFFSSLWAGHLCVKIGIYKVALIGTLGFFLCGVLMLLWTLESGTSLASFLLPSYLSAVVGAFMLGAGAGGALEPFGDMAGTAAALLGSSQFILATIVGSFVMQWPVGSNLSFALPLIIFGGVSWIVLLCYRRKKTHSANFQ